MSKFTTTLDEQAALALNAALEKEIERIAQNAIDAKEDNELSRAARLVRQFQALRTIKDELQIFGQKEFFGW